jgi:HEAT repeat protein
MRLLSKLKNSLKLACLIAALGATSLLQAQSTIDGKHDPLVDWPMMVDPVVKDSPTVKDYDPRCVELWIQALSQPDIDTRRLAAQTITRAAGEGFPDLDKTVPGLSVIVKDLQNHRFLLINASQALIAINASQNAPDLFALNKTGDEDLILITDAALAKWGFTQAAATWLTRMGDDQAPRIARESAIRQLGAMPHKGAFEPLIKFASAQGDDGLRLLAARSAVQCRESQSTYQSAQALSTGSKVDRLIAAVLLEDQTTSESINLLVKLAQDSQATVAGQAMRQLLSQKPLAVAACQAKVLASPDANVRLLAVKAVGVQKSPACIIALAPLLDDVNPNVRRQVRDQFLEQAKDPGLKATIIAQADKVLNLDSWRGQEQAALILGKLQNKPSIDRLIELVDSPRYETAVASATALRWIGDHSIAPRLFVIAQRFDKGMPVEKAPEPAPEPAPDKNAKAPAKKPAPAPKKTQAQEDIEKAIKQQVANNWLRTKDNILTQFIHIFKDANYREAEPLLRKYVPKHSTDYGTARAAAIWALGYFYEGKADTQLASAFAGRATDVNPMDPESPLVQRFCVISIGRMKAKSGMGALTAVLKTTNGLGEFADAARWAQHEITGKSDPAPEPSKSYQYGWFLDPIRDEPKSASAVTPVEKNAPAKPAPKPAAKPAPAKAPAEKKK